MSILGRIRDRQNVRADVPGAVVDVEVATGQAGDVRVADDVAARDRAAADAMRVLVDRWDVIRRLRAVAEEMPALHAAPAEVGCTPPPHVDRAVVDLLPDVLADVADREGTRQAVEREAPRVTQAVRPDLGPPRRLTDEWVVRRHRVRIRPVLPGIDADDLATQILKVL